MPFGAQPRGAPKLAVFWYLVGIAGLAMSLTLLFLSMRAVMDIGGMCAEGGPYVPVRSCPEGAPLATMAGMFGLFIFGGLALWSGGLLGGSYWGLVLLAWPVLFVSLGWNFLEYGLSPPGVVPEEQGIVWGWIVCGVVFMAMGAGPLLLLPWFRSSTSGTAQSVRFQANTLARRDQGAAGSIPYLAVIEPGSQGEASGGDRRGDLVDRLERLAALREQGALTADDYESAKRSVLESASAGDDARAGEGSAP